MCDDTSKPIEGECGPVKKLRISLNEYGLIEGLEKFAEEMKDEIPIARQALRVGRMVKSLVEKAKKDIDISKASTNDLMAEIAKRIDIANQPDKC